MISTIQKCPRLTQEHIKILQSSTGTIIWGHLKPDEPSGQGGECEGLQGQRVLLLPAVLQLATDCCAPGASGGCWEWHSETSSTPGSRTRVVGVDKLDAGDWDWAAQVQNKVSSNPVGCNPVVPGHLHLTPRQHVDGRVTAAILVSWDHGHVGIHTRRGEGSLCQHSSCQTQAGQWGQNQHVLESYLHTNTERHAVQYYVLSKYELIYYALAMGQSCNLISIFVMSNIIVKMCTKLIFYLTSLTFKAQSTLHWVQQLGSLAALLWAWWGKAVQRVMPGDKISIWAHTSLPPWSVGTPDTTRQLASVCRVWLILIIYT